MAKRSLSGSSRSESFIKRRFAKAEFHAIASQYTAGDFENFLKPNSWNFIRFPIAFSRKMSRFLRRQWFDRRRGRDLGCIVESRQPAVQSCESTWSSEHVSWSF